LFLGGCEKFYASWVTFSHIFGELGYFFIVPVVSCGYITHGIKKVNVSSVEFIGTCLNWMEVEINKLKVGNYDSSIVQLNCWL
jgi:Na+/H+-dicarboxylate symporter